MGGHGPLEIEVRILAKSARGGFLLFALPHEQET